MEQTGYQKQLDPLALALTRSPTFMGVNVRVFFANLAGCALLCIDAHTFWGVPLFVMLHLLLVRLSVKEPDFLFLRIKSLVYTPPVLNRWYWGHTNSYEPW